MNSVDLDMLIEFAFIIGQSDKYKEIDFMSLVDNTKYDGITLFSLFVQFCYKSFNESDTYSNYEVYLNIYLIDLFKEFEEIYYDK